ncbi:hypothetical protein FOA52_000685 [Chlamydomonas sp. UWO 241]|nr:hypothetical protein FOA52_000685 [Chlamydomonas sp. UWO 241]
MPPGSLAPEPDVMTSATEAVATIARGIALMGPHEYAVYLPGWVPGSVVPCALVRKLWPLPKKLTARIKATQLYRAFPALLSLESTGANLALRLMPEARAHLAPYTVGAVGAPMWAGPHAPFRHLGRIVVQNPEVQPGVVMSCHQAAEALARSLTLRPRSRSLLPFVEKDLERKLAPEVLGDRGYSVKGFVMNYPDLFSLVDAGAGREAVELAPGAMTRLAAAGAAAAAGGGAWNAAAAGGGGGGWNGAVAGGGGGWDAHAAAAAAAAAGGGWNALAAHAPGCGGHDGAAAAAAAAAAWGLVSADTGATANGMYTAYPQI